MVCRECKKEFVPPKLDGKDAEVCYECWSEDVDSCFPVRKMSTDDKVTLVVVLVALIILILGAIYAK